MPCAWVDVMLAGALFCSEYGSKDGHAAHRVPAWQQLSNELLDAKACWNGTRCMQATLFAHWLGLLDGGALDADLAGLLPLLVGPRCEGARRHLRQHAQRIRFEDLGCVAVWGASKSTAAARLRRL